MARQGGSDAARRKHTDRGKLLVRERVDRVTIECASMIADVIRTDTGLPDEASELLAVSLVGMAQVSARFWLAGGGGITQDDAAALIAGLAWRGIRGYPMTDDH